MTENEDYKFRSELTKECLPYGVSHLSEVKREEVSGILKIMGDKARASGWILMFFCHCLGENSWNEDAVLGNMKRLRADINALKGKLRD